MGEEEYLFCTNCGSTRGSQMPGYQLQGQLSDLSLANTHIWQGGRSHQAAASASMANPSFQTVPYTNFGERHTNFRARNKARMDV